MLIEHDLDVVFELADTVTVLHLGEHLMTGTPEAVRASDGGPDRLPRRGRHDASCSTEARS